MCRPTEKVNTTTGYFYPNFDSTGPLTDRAGTLSAKTLLTITIFRHIYPIIYHYFLWHIRYHHLFGWIMIVPLQCLQLLKQWPWWRQRESAFLHRWPRCPLERANNNFISKTVEEIFWKKVSGSGKFFDLTTGVFRPPVIIRCVHW